MAEPKDRCGVTRGDERHLAETMIAEASAAREDEGDCVIVGWDGPDDPNDPKKSDLPTTHDTRLKYSTTAGNSTKNGSPLRWHPPTHS